MTDNPPATPTEQPYREPNAHDDVYPEAWTPKQRENWRRFGHFEYELLETDVGRLWYRATWRPKMRGDGMMQHDHVTLGTHEDYVADNVRDRLSPMSNITSVMMRRISANSEVREYLDRAVDDIVAAKLELKDPQDQERLVHEATQLARAYGLEPEDTAVNTE